MATICALCANDLGRLKLELLRFEWCFCQGEARAGTFEGRPAAGGRGERFSLGQHKARVPKKRHVDPRRRCWGMLAIRP
jgi:hypothetical protein